MLQSDFGRIDGSISAMYGVAYTVNNELTISDLSHDVPTYDVHRAAYQLYQTIQYWPKGTVFVSVVNPSSKEKHRRVICRTKNGRYIVAPDNGTFTYIDAYIGIDEVRELGELQQKIPESSNSHTFLGRDIYVYNGALLASGDVRFRNMGTRISENKVQRFPVILPKIDTSSVEGTIDMIDTRFGSLWTNLPERYINSLAIRYGDTVNLQITNKDKTILNTDVLFSGSFGDVAVGEPVAYINSLQNIGIGLNQASFSDKYPVEYGPDWHIKISKRKR